MLPDFVLDPVRFLQQWTPKICEGGQGSTLPCYKGSSFPCLSPNRKHTTKGTKDLHCQKPTSPWSPGSFRAYWARVAMTATVMKNKGLEPWGSNLGLTKLCLGRSRVLPLVLPAWSVSESHVSSLRRKLIWYVWVFHCFYKNSLK